jgi:hypothetical protein
MIRAVLDTNVFISMLFLNSGATFQKLYNALTHNRFQLLTTKNIVQETAQVLKKPALLKHHRMDTAEQEQVIRSILQISQIIPIRTTISIPELRDKNDDMFLQCAYNGTADYLVTGDNDLLVLKKLDQTKIVTPARFVQKLSV